MKKKYYNKQKGFTLVELLAVLILLGLIIVIAIPTINKSLESSKEKARKTQEGIIINAAKSYAAENASKITNCTTYLTIEDLLKEDYIDSSKADNIKESDLIEMCVKVTSEYNQYTYKISECAENVYTCDEDDND